MKQKKKNEEKKAKSKAKVDVSVLSEFFVACFLAQSETMRQRKCCLLFGAAKKCEKR